MPRGHPAWCIRGFRRKGRIESGFVAVSIGYPQVHVIKMQKGREHDFWRKGERGDYSPRRDGSVVRAIGHASRQIIEENTTSALH